MATVADLHGIKQLLLPLEESGTLIKRTEEEVCTCDLAYYLILQVFISRIMFVSLIIIPTVQLLRALDSFIVVEREGQIIACGALFPFFEEKRGEVAAIAVSPECRGQGLGDKLLGMVSVSLLYCILPFLLNMKVHKSMSSCINIFPTDSLVQIWINYGKKSTNGI